MNIIDLQFYRLAEEISALSRGALYEKMRTSFDGLSPDIRNRLSVYFGKFGFWGKLDPANGVFEEIELKADELHNHINDFVWLYGRLSDYRSKKTLYAVLNNWYAYDFKTTSQVKEYAFDEYFDHDIIPDARDEVFVDLGAYFGESTLSFVLNYGKESYRKIYCYEITPSVFAELKKTMSVLPDIECRHKGVSDREGVMKIAFCPASISANSLADEGDAEVAVTSLDLDIDEPVTIIKADIEGGEQRALAGARRHIENEHPKLLFSVYHRNEDLWKIPRIIDGMSDDYRFFLRFKGTATYPTEITLFSV